MTIAELRTKLNDLTIELDRASMNKAASKRARKILSEIKNATPQLRKELIELDNTVK